MKTVLIGSISAFCIGAIVFSLAKCGNITNAWLTIIVNVVSSLIFYACLYFIEKKNTAVVQVPPQGLYVNTVVDSGYRYVNAKVVEGKKAFEGTLLLNQSTEKLDF